MMINSLLLECNCNLEGTIGSLDTCESKTGQCTCKPNVQGRICDSCTDGTFDLYSGSLFGCKGIKIIVIVKSRQM